MSRTTGFDRTETRFSRRRLYRHTKRLLLKLLARRWKGPRDSLEPAVRRFLRDRARCELSRMVGNRGVAMATAAVLLAAGMTGTAHAIPPIELSDIASGDGGFVINGIDPDDNSGFSVSDAGDVNGDGLNDLIVGAFLADPDGYDQAGECYVVFDKADGTAMNLSDVSAGTGGFVIKGTNTQDRSSFSVSGAGDVNGDGLADLIVGAYLADPGGKNRAGESYVIFGKADGVSVNLSDVAAGNGGFIINGIDPIDDSGRSVSGAGDVNGDDLDDLIVGAWYASPKGTLFAGESYVIFGKTNGDPVNLSDVTAGIGGFVINGTNIRDYSGFSVSGAGDVNGDGLADFIVGAWDASPIFAQEGESYVVFGKMDGTAVNLANVATSIGGFVINGIDPFDSSGYSVSGAGDVNGDGLADLIVGAPHADPIGSPLAGESYVIFGKVDGTSVNLSDVSASSGGFIIIGIDTYDSSGTSVSGAGDVNGDGLADLIVGAHFAGGFPYGAGESYVIFRESGGVTGESVLYHFRQWGICHQWHRFE